MSRKIKIDGAPVKLDEGTCRIDVFLDYFERVKKRMESVT
jgi:hypothetical protein